MDETRAGRFGQLLSAALSRRRLTLVMIARSALAETNRSAAKGKRKRNHPASSASLQRRKKNCKSGLQRCGKKCADLTKDPSHCGTCKTVCTSPAICCAGACFDPTTDPDACGGSCPCLHGEVCCSAVCTETLSDAANCGACGHQCDRGKTCCNGKCALLTVDPDHCGDCANQCRPSESCCDGRCVNLDNDSGHCGSCDSPCAASESCCSGGCVDLLTDPVHCGDCRTRCANNQVCVNGGCDCSDQSCGAGKGCCSHTCIDITSDHANCGRCGNECDPIATCQDATCVSPGYRFVTQWGGAGSGDGRLNYALDIAFAPDKTVVVADSGNSRIQRFSSTGTFLAKWGAQGSGPGQFTESIPAVGVGPDGTVYAVDEEANRVQRFDATGAFLGSWGDGEGDDQLVGPFTLDIAGDGTIFVVEGSCIQHQGDYCIKQFDPSGNYLGKMTIPLEADFNLQAQDIALTSDGNVAVFTGPTIRFYSTTGELQGRLVTDGSWSGDRISIGADGRIYISAGGSAGKVYVLDSNGDLLAAWGGNGDQPGTFDGLWNLAVNEQNQLYVASGTRVQIFERTS